MTRIVLIARRLLRKAVPALLVLVALNPAQAQFEQYTPSGEFGDREGSLREALDAALAAAPWGAGQVRFSPWLALRDIEFVDNARAARPGEEVSDVTVTVGAGLRAYVPVGDVLVAAYALPEYVWWRDLDRRRRLNGRYGAGLFGTLGKADFHLTFARSETTRYFSRQIEERVNLEEDRAELAVEVPLSGGVAFFGAASVRDVAYPDDEAVLEDLSVADREEVDGRLGLRFLSARGLTVGLLWETNETDFDSIERDRSNSGDSPRLEIQYESARYYLQATLVERSLEPDGLSEFLPYEEVTGKLRISVRPIPPFELQLFANRNLVYTTGSQWVYFEDASLGLATNLSLGSRAKIRIFAERGEDDYTPFAGQVGRLDDFDAYGANLRIKLGRASLRFGARRTDYDSILDGADREINVLSANVTIRGSSGSPWT